MADALADAARLLRETVAATAALPADDRAATLRRLLSREVHDALLRARTDGDDHVPDSLAELAAAVREHVPDGTEDRLATRIRVLIRLLRRGALEPAWMLAHDNASGRVKPRKASSTWAGGSFLTTALSLPTVTEHGSVYAWLPGLHDPRWGVPSDVYAMDSSVILQHRLDGLRIDGDALQMYGVGYLSQLTTGPDDRVTLVLTDPSAGRHRVRAARARRPDLVAPRGPELTRLAWGGWHVAVPLGPIADSPGTWRVSIEVEIGGACRSGPLGGKRGPLVDPRRDGVAGPAPGGAMVRCDLDRDGHLVLRVAEEATGS